MNAGPAPVAIKILDKEYRIACPAEEQAALLASADYLSARMKEVRDTGRVIGIDRIAVMAALNIVHELLQHREQIAHFDQAVGPRLLELQGKIETALERGKQMEF